MRSLFVIAMLLMFGSCRQKTETTTTEIEVVTETTGEAVTFDWLIGRWERANEEEGKATYEIWTKKGVRDYAGFGYTLENKDTIWQERMRLNMDQGYWVLAIQAHEDPEPVIFRMTQKTDTGFTCENPELEFPKSIQYRKSKGGFEATVSNEETEIAFEFGPADN